MKKDNMSTNGSRLEIRTFLNFRETQEQNAILIVFVGIKK